MNKAQTVYTSKLLNKKEYEEIKATRREYNEIDAIDSGLAMEHKNDHVCYVNVGGMTIPTGCAI